MTALTLHQNELANMLELAPVSLWVEDFSALHQLLTQWRAGGVSDLRG